MGMFYCRKAMLIGKTGNRANRYLNIEMSLLHFFKFLKSTYHFLLSNNYYMKAKVFLVV